MSKSHEALAGYPVVTTISVLWGDMDSFAHVNNLAYLKWCETGRVEYLTRISAWVAQLEGAVGPILAALSCNYRRPLTYPDEVYIGSRVTRIGNSSVRMEHVVVSREAGQVAAEVDSTIVLLDYATGKPVRVPDPIRRAIEELEGRSFADQAVK
jgi:acyl-CoA thioester hydrolase